jgi:lipopolysaccharide/colanic/teichoic acid biosynthesis glycosyltransferase
VKKQRFQIWILAADLLWVSVAMVLAYLLRYRAIWYPRGAFIGFLPLLAASLVLWAGMFSWMKLDGFRLGWHMPTILSQLLVAACCLISVLLAGSFVTLHYVSRLALAYFGVFLLVGLVIIRYIMHALLRSRHMTDTARRVLILGNGPVAREMASKIDRHPEMLCRVVGFLCSVDTSFDSRVPEISNGAVTVQTLGVIDLLRELQIDEVIITHSKPASAEIMNLAASCRREGIGVSIVPHPYELYLSKPELLDIGGLPVLQLRDADAGFAHSASKRVFDIALGLIFSILALPLISIGAMLLLRKRGGPFRRELRCGQLGKQFWMLRLNSDRGSEILPNHECLLQQLSVTELPQLLNVLRGEMSLVGPRPESPDRVKHYSDWQRQRLNVKPGMTGLAQVHGLREQHSSEEKARFDLQYMLHSSPFLDVSLLLQTVWTLIARIPRIGNLPMSYTQMSTPKAEGVFEGVIPNAHSTQSSAD